MSLSFGIIGFGRIGQRHASVIEKHPECELIAYCDPIQSVAFPDALWFSDIGKFLGQVSYDVICVCSPNGLHAIQAIAALNGGAHVICEKPLALTAEDANAMTEAAAANGKHLVCVLQNRYSPHTRWLKNLIESDGLGEVYQVQVNCFWNRDNRYFLSGDGGSHPWHGSKDLDGGPVFTQFSHFVDLLVWLFGELKPLNSLFRNFSHEDTVQFEDAGKFDFTFGERGFGSFHYSIAVWDTNQESSITIIGSKGSVRLAGQYMDILEYCHIDGIERPDPMEWKLDIEGDDTVSNHYRVVDNLVNAILRDEPLHFNIADAVAGVSLIEEVYRRRDL